MIYKIADNITSPLGLTTDENYLAVRQDTTSLRSYEGLWGLPEPFMGSLFEEKMLERHFAERLTSPKDYTRFEQIALLSATQAVAQADIDTGSPRCLFVLSTTKGNVALLHDQPVGAHDPRLNLAVTARKIARYFGNVTEPIVVSNACVSGLCALITAMRMLQSGAYDTAIVIGADVLSAFVVSGFQSLKAFSPLPCQPFSENRMGLNLGEAAATLILRRDETPTNAWQLLGGAIRNDAHHLSSPSPMAIGGRLALEATSHYINKESLAVINAHGTATLYNDEMEAKAITGAGLADVPVNGYKGYFGHTMGAAGVLETVLTMRSLDDGLLLPTRGFDALGVSKPLHIVRQLTPTPHRSFLKMMSGFGGSHAALALSRQVSTSQGTATPCPQQPLDTPNID